MQSLLERIAIPPREGILYPPMGGILYPWRGEYYPLVGGNTMPPMGAILCHQGWNTISLVVEIAMIPKLHTAIFEFAHCNFMICLLQFRDLLIAIFKIDYFYFEIPI